jgi:hypothetical protein
MAGTKAEEPEGAATCGGDPAEPRPESGAYLRIPDTADTIPAGPSGDALADLEALAASTTADEAREVPAATLLAAPVLGMLPPDSAALRESRTQGDPSLGVYRSVTPRRPRSGTYPK